jgi:hypothetical protein
MINCYFIYDSIINENIHSKGLLLFAVKCGSGWVQYKQKCVKYFNQTVKFFKAEKICESNNATLISIHSAEENEFIRSYVEKQPSLSISMWIGLKRNISGSQEFVWVDKSPVDYVNWSIYQPDNYGTLEPYIEMMIHKNGTWNDILDGYFVFVCGINCKSSIKFQKMIFFHN